MRLGLLGYGAIASLALDALAKALPAPIDCLICLAKPDGVARARDLLARFSGARESRVVTDIEELITARVDVVAEAAGHVALRENGARALEAGADLIVSSVGALADTDLHQALRAAAERGGAELVISNGAVGGLDILAAARLSGLSEVIYTSRKPPRAWRGTKAEGLIDLDTLEVETTFYDGPAAHAARDYPQNANVAATIALAGLGFEKTRVRLVADPSATRNVHEILARSGCADMTISIAGWPSPDNPKTSMTTGYSLAEAILTKARRRRA